MSWNLRRRLLSGNKDIENRRIVRVTCVLFISGILLTGADAVRSVKQLQPRTIERNDCGKGSKTEVLDVKSRGIQRKNKNRYRSIGTPVYDRRDTGTVRKDYPEDGQADTK